MAELLPFSNADGSSHVPQPPFPQTSIFLPYCKTPSSFVPLFTEVSNFVMHTDANCATLKLTESYKIWTKETQCPPHGMSCEPSFFFV